MLKKKLQHKKKEKGGENKVPVNLEELKDAIRDYKKVAGKKIEWQPIVQQIVQSKQFWTVKEVHEQLIKKQIGRFRTMKLLNGSCTVKKLEKLYQNGRFYYGAPTTTTKK